MANRHIHITMPKMLMSGALLERACSVAVTSFLLALLVSSVPIT